MDGGPPKEFITSIRENDKIEVIVPCVGFDDMLTVSLAHNLPHVDNLIVVTTNEDAATHRAVSDQGATLVRTDLFQHQDHTFAKGAALNAGLSRCQYRGWRLVLDADILLPDNFRRVLINHTHLDQQCLYGADRVDVVGDALRDLKQPQWGHREEVFTGLPIRSRVVTRLSGYLPLGYFQLWHASSAYQEYPYSAGGAGLDDVLFAQQWPVSHRRLLPSIIVYHICSVPPTLGENWDGIRRHPRYEGA
jgi:hypothetical protein